MIHPSGTPRKTQLNDAESRVVGRRRAIFLISASLVVLLVGIAIHWPFKARPKIELTTRPVVPVSIAVAHRKNVPIHLTGLGAVQASSTVGIRPQIDGTLQEVLFIEGQNVKKGDALAKIDPRLFKATLDQARGKRAQDAALLIAAEKDLDRFRTLQQSAIETQQNVDQQQAKVDQLKASVATDEAEIEIAQTRLNYTTIMAPSDGRIGIQIGRAHV